MGLKSPTNRGNGEEKMGKHNMEWYIANNDFEGAKERFDTTSPTWKKRWFEVCYKIFNSCKELAKKYVLNPLDYSIHKIGEVVAKRRTKYADKIMLSDDCPSLLDEATQKCYLFTFYNENNELVCSKVGTTIRGVRQRLTEELRSDTYKKMGCVRAVVHRVYDCGRIPAEGLESFFRAEYIRKYPDSFKKNDRFIGTHFDFAEADRIASAYLG